MSDYERLVKSTTEEEIVELIAKKLISPPSPGEYLKYPDDARDIIPRAPRIITSIDAYSIRSLSLPWRSLSDIGWSAVTGSISDIVVKGGIPHAIMIALGIPDTWSLAQVNELIEGVGEASEHYGVKVLGGDTNSSLDAWIAVSTIGFTSARIPPSRGGLKPGDTIIVTGIYGAMGFIAKHGLKEASHLKWVIDATRKPRVKVEIAHIIAGNYRSITASMDVSDGLGYTLSVMSRLSNYGISIKTPPRVYQEILEICRQDVLCILDYALNGGEEYGVVLGVKKDSIRTVTEDLDYYGVDYSIVGVVVDTEPGVYYNGVKLAIQRYDQFKGWTTL